MLSRKYGDVSAVPQRIFAARRVRPSRDVRDWFGHTVPLGLDHRNPYRTGLDSDEQEHESFGTVQNACLEEGVHGTYSKEESGRHKQKRKYSQLVGIRVRHRLDCLYRSGAKPDYVNLKDPATPASIG
jgi:hypothetical protein